MTMQIKTQFHKLLTNTSTSVIPAGTAGNQLPWMAYTFATLNSIDTYIPVVLIPAIHAGMTDLL